MAHEPFLVRGGRVAADLFCTARTRSRTVLQYSNITPPKPVMTSENQDLFSAWATRTRVCRREGGSVRGRCGSRLPLAFMVGAGWGRFRRTRLGESGVGPGGDGTAPETSRAAEVIYFR